MSVITARHRRLVDHYLALGCHLGNAARAAGLSLRAAQNAMRRPEVKEHLEQRQNALSAAVTASATEVVSLLVAHLRADIADVMPDEPIVQAARAAGVSHLIKKIRVKETQRRTDDDAVIVDRHVEVEMHDSQRAAGMLAKIFGIAGEDDLQKARNAIKLYMELQQCPAEVAIVALAPHVPAVLRVRDEFVRLQLPEHSVAESEEQ